MRSLPFVFALAALATACEKSAIVWSDPAPIAQAPGATRLVVDSAGHARFVADSIVLPSVPAAPGLCTASVRSARGTSRLFVGWWSVRRDSSAVLYTAASTDGGTTWGNPSPVDTSDISTRGCDRPPPSLATVGDDVYVAYSIHASDGISVYFAHFMGNMLHSPVAVIYGERLVPTALAAEGMRVALAYEEPNGARQRVDLALSNTQGHIFETHTTATREDDVGTDPAVALAGRTLAVSWRARASDDSTGARVVRVGTIQ
ncbi:MAG TPA: hypothetical protein VHB25_02465 [Gemmatimonadaceae bacterium]|nr:hypothetical protein [Gemmatimonadaceae bacterium]